jgi:uncharacterized protein YndB with AHSA1/START domain
MRVQHITAEATTKAHPADVWALLSDRSTWPSWSPLGSHTGVSPGADGDPDGVGAVAEFVTGRTRVREEIVVREPLRRLSYRLLSGLPLRDYLAVVELTPSGTGTHIRWSSSYRSGRPGLGWLYRIALTRVIRGMVAGLASAALARR